MTTTYRILTAITPLHLFLDIELSDEQLEDLAQGTDELDQLYFSADGNALIVFGHEGDDHSLIRFVCVVKSTLHQTDLLVRLGGEFSVLMPDPSVHHTNLR